MSHITTCNNRKGLFNLNLTCNHDILWMDMKYISQENEGCYLQIATLYIQSNSCTNIAPCLFICFEYLMIIVPNSVWQYRVINRFSYTLTKQTQLYFDAKLCFMSTHPSKILLLMNQVYHCQSVIFPPCTLLAASLTTKIREGDIDDKSSIL